ncbi:otoconin-90-like [Panonychus citri]|uniref:otoconin-90-like n=1 Tax=Panonychus citri TaxID=50023 RepID=UPI002306FA9D|nr:otoconin-90-like [Panonychus citri]
MINFPLQRLSSVRYPMSTTTFGLTIVLIFLFILINLISSLENNQQINNSTDKIIIIKTIEMQSNSLIISVNNQSDTENLKINKKSVNNKNKTNQLIPIANDENVSNQLMISSNVTSKLLLDDSDNHHHQLTNSVHRSLRVKRGLIQLASMIKCVSGCEPFQYKGYGCFCGLFGSGKPVDPIDRCCLKHDHCYAMAPCHQLLLYLMPYSWDCVAPGYANCALADYSQSKDKCGFSLCECDRIFAECISKYPCPSSKAKCPYKPMVLTVYGK